MKEWSAARLLHRVSFLDLDELTDNAPVQDAEHVVLLDGEIGGRVRLLDWLADNYCDVLRLVTLHTASKDGDECDGVRKAERLRAELMHWIGSQQKLVTLACFLVDPDEARIHLDSVLPTWSANLVISPTDQALPAGAAAPVPANHGSVPNPVFADLASQNLCTIGGVWRFQHEGPLDDAHPHSQAAGVQVIRSFVRCLDLEDPTLAVTEDALQRGADGSGAAWPVPVASPSVVTAMPADSFSLDAVKQVGDRHARVIDAVILAAPIPRPRTQISLWVAIKTFFSFMFRGVLKAPRVLTDAAVGAASTAASTMATTMIFGRASEYEVKVGRPRLRPTSDTEALQRAVESAIRIADPTATFMPPATRDLWQEYLRVGIALVDGSAMPPTQIRPQIGDARAVLPDPNDVAIRPDYPELTIGRRTLDQPSDSILSAEDPLGVLIVKASLQARLTALAGDHESPGPGSLQNATPNPDSPIGEPAGDAAPAGEANEDEADAARLRMVTETQSELSRIDEWIADTREPYTWQLGMRIARSLSETETRLLAAATTLEQLQRPQPVSDDIRTRQIWTALATGLAFCVGFVLLGVLQWLEWDWAGPLAAASLLMGVWSSFHTFLSDLKRRFRIVHAYESGIDQLNEASEAFSHYARETLRLNSVYWQYQQWTPMLATVLHDPFAGTPPIPPKAEPTFIANAPRSTRSGTARPDALRLETLTHEARRRIFTTGWASRCWEAGQTYLLEDFRVRRAIEEAIDPFDENLRQRSGILEYLRQGFLHGAHGAACRQQPETSTRNLITSSPISSLTSTVLINGKHQYPDAPAPVDADPAEGLFQEILPDQGDGHFAASLWRKEGLGAPIDVRQKIIAMVPGWKDRAPEGTRYADTVPVQHDGQLLFAAIRVDLSEPCSPMELTVFESSRRVDEKITSWPSPGDD